jgi:hypothetical protein
MAQQHVLYRTLTLEASLEEVILLGKAYRFTGAGKEWNPSELLEWLQQKHPDLLSLPVALFPPSAHGDGVVFDVDLEGAPMTDVPLYFIEQRGSTGAPR